MRNQRFSADHIYDIKPLEPTGITGATQYIAWGSDSHMNTFGGVKRRVDQERYVPVAAGDAGCRLLVAVCITTSAKYVT